MSTNKKFAAKVTVDELEKMLAAVKAEYGSDATRALGNEPDITDDVLGFVRDFAQCDQAERERASAALRKLLDNSPAKREAEIDPLRFKEQPSDKNALALPPLDKLTKEWPNSIQDVCRKWVWITAAKRFVNRLNPSMMWDTVQFDSEFARFTEKNSISKELFKEGNLLRKFPTLVYRCGAGEIVGDDYNMWRPSPIIAAEGDTSLFHKHVAFQFPNAKDQKLLLDWLAGVLQSPNTKPRHQLFIHGKVQGSGKTFFARLMRELLGHSNCEMLTQDILENGFTGWALHSKLVWIEEVRELTGSKKATSKLHSWASESTITINQKNMPTFPFDQSIAFMIFSNKPDALALDNSDRRYLVLRTDASVHRDGAPYYDALYGVKGVGGILNDPAALGAILYELLNRPLGGYSIEQAAPGTDAKRDMIDAGADDVERWLIEHRHEAPLSHTYVTLNEILASMPDDVQKAKASGKSARVRIPEVLAARFNGENICADGRKVYINPKIGQLRLWALHRRDRNKSVRDVLDDASIARVYVAEHWTPTPQELEAGKPGLAEAAREFGADPV